MLGRIMDRFENVLKRDQQDDEIMEAMEAQWKAQEETNKRQEGLLDQIVSILKNNHPGKATESSHIQPVCVPRETAMPAGIKVVDDVQEDDAQPGLGAAEQRAELRNPTRICEPKEEEAEELFRSSAVSIPKL
ncbi:hypothetical protein MMC27_001960 [Xylographa pallens]|nr:hypothetical protein [Xylographa pallens]